MKYLIQINNDDGKLMLGTKVETPHEVGKAISSMLGVRIGEWEKMTIEIDKVES